MTASGKFHKQSGKGWSFKTILMSVLPDDFHSNFAVMLTISAIQYRNNTSQKNENFLSFAVDQHLGFLQTFEKFQPER